MILKFLTSRAGIILTSVVLLTLSGLWIKSLYSDIATIELERDSFKASHAVCENDKKIANEVSNDYQEKLTALDIQLLELRGLYDTTCVKVNSSSSGHNATTAEGELRGQDGIEAKWLIEYAGDAERVRLRLISCQDFINRLSEND